MTISSTVRRAGPYATDGVQTSFPFAFKVFNGEDVQVTQTALSGTATVLVLNTDYTVTLNVDQEASPGGTVITTSALDDVTISIISDMEIEQPAVFTNSGGFYPRVLNDSLDRRAIVEQQLEERLDRAFLLPLDAAALVGKYPVVLADGDIGWSDGTSTDAALRTDLASANGAALVTGAISGVASLTALAALTPAADRVRYVMTGAGQGYWRCLAGAAPADALNGLYKASGTAGFYWARIWEGWPRAEWWGAVLDNGAVDSGPALQACLDMTGRLYFPKGLYYGSTGLVDTVGCIIKGSGVLFSGYACSSPTAHLLSNQGVANTSFANGGDYSDFTLARTVTPTTPGSTAADKTQGHGLHIDLTSNTRIHNVYTYNNLVEFYHSRTLALQASNIRGLRQTGGGGDRWYGYYCYGDPTGMPGGWASGPSGNPSCTIKKVQMVAAGTGSATNFKFERHLQDLWCEDMEAGGGYVQFDIDPQSYPCNDFFLIRPVADGYLTHGIKVKDMPLGGCAVISHGWVAPSGSATSSGIDIDGGHGLEISCKGDFGLASGLRGVNIANTSRLNGDFNMVNCQYPMVGDVVNTSHLKVHGYKDYAGANFGDVVTLTNSNTTKVEVAVVAVGAQKFLAAVKLDAATYQLVIDVSRVLAGSAANRLVANGAAITTQGNVGNNHVVMNPGAGAML